VIDAVGGQEVDLAPRARPELVDDLLAQLQRRALATDVEDEVL
jgi:hypothetical protein